MHLLPADAAEDEPSAKLPVGSAEVTVAGLLATIGVVCQLGWKSMAVSPSLVRAANPADRRPVTLTPSHPEPRIATSYCPETIPGSAFTIADRAAILTAMLSEGKRQIMEYCDLSHFRLLR